MRRTELLQEVRKMGFLGAYERWRRGYLTQEGVGGLLGMSGRNFRRSIERYHDEGEAGLLERRLAQASNRAAPVDEVLALCDLYSGRYSGWNVKHFYWFYRERHGCGRSYTWVKNTLQERGLVASGWLDA